MTILLTSYSAKLDKSQTNDWLNAVMYLDPSYHQSVCKGKSRGCYASCLVNSGRMGMTMAVNARKARTERYFNQKELFIIQLKGEIASKLMQAQKQGKRLAIRLNGTSDLDWTDVYKTFPMIQFYEYTKRIDLAKKLSRLDNVDVTFSKHENHSNKAVKKVLESGINVAVVFKNKVPESFIDIKVIDGDKHDRRFEDDKGRIIGLKLKGTNNVKQLAIESGFAI
jgi:hypothetical protein